MALRSQSLWNYLLQQPLKQLPTQAKEIAGEENN
jgi:hypothetical protein